MYDYIIFDTETTGLNIRTDRPFLLPYMLVKKNFEHTEVITLDVTDVASIRTFLDVLKDIPTVVGHNIKFDVHMLLNIGVDPSYFEDKNYIDTGVLARLVISHDEQRDNTFSTALKKLAQRYLNVNAALEEQRLKQQLSTLTAAHKEKLFQYLSTQNVWKKEWTGGKKTKVLNEIYNNWFKYFHKYPQITPYRKKFFDQVPAPTYKDVSNVRTYAATDVLLTYRLFRMWYPMIPQKKQVPTLKRISKVTWPLVLMERRGIPLNVHHILEDRKRLLEQLDQIHIIDPRTGDEYSVGQHEKLRELYEYETGLKLSNADKNTRKQIESKSPSARKANLLAQMTKYLNSYMTRLLKNVVYVDGQYKIFTQYNLAGTVTGRLSSDVQQFPKEPLELPDDTVVNIRSWFIVPNDAEYLFYFDYSQMELRLQCEWTGVVNGQPDLNMIRAFKPYQCHRHKNGGDIIYYDGEPEEIYSQYEWYLDEDVYAKWEPTDLHGLTTKNAFPKVDETHADWTHFRQLGKRTNFAVNYGAAAPKIAEALDVDLSTAKALVNGYQQAFKGIVDFNEWLRKRSYVTASTPNLLARYYYSRNKHLLQNWLVQGSGADILLEAITAVYQYIKDKPWWQFYITVHDEIGYTCTALPSKQLQEEVQKIKEIMTYHMTHVSATVDVEYTKTTWAEKEEYHYDN